MVKLEYTVKEINQKILNTSRETNNIFLKNKNDVHQL